MNRLTRLGLHTPLWRRVQRHAQMSVLFGRPAATAVSPAHSPQTSLTWSMPQPDPPSAALPIEPAIPQTALAQPAVQRATVQRTDPLETAVSANPVPAPATPPSSDKAEEEANWRRLQTIMQRHRQKQAAEDVTQTGEPPNLPPVPPEPEPEIPAHGIEPALEAPNDPEAPAVQSVQSMPLEAAWPVQKKEQPKQAEPPRQKPAAQPPTVQREPLPKAEAAKINQNLDQVAPGRRTESPIETILPSRPRPQPAARPPAPEVPNPSPTAAETAATAVPPAAPSNPSNPPKLIQTEIGPLPADLWETLGQMPPASPSPPMVQPAAPEQTASTPSKSLLPDRSDTAVPAPQAAIMRTPATPQQDSPPPAVETDFPQANLTELPNSTKPPQFPIEEAKQPPAAQAVQPQTRAAQQTGPIQAKAFIQRQPSRAEPTAAAAIFTGTPPTVTEATAKSVDSTAIPTSPAAKIRPAAKPETHLLSTDFASAQPIAELKAQPAHAVPGRATRLPTETAVPNQPSIQRQPTPAPPQAIVQRQPDMPQMLETAAASVEMASSLPFLETAVAPDTPAEAPAAPSEAAASDDSLDLDALAQQVYQQLKRKLAVEWERGYGR